MKSTKTNDSQQTVVGGGSSFDEDSTDVIKIHIPTDTSDDINYVIKDKSIRRRNLKILAFVAIVSVAVSVGLGIWIVIEKQCERNSSLRNVTIEAQIPSSTNSSTTTSSGDENKNNSSIITSNSTTTEKRQWPELLKKEGTAAKVLIEAERPDLEIQIISDQDFVTADYVTTRVRIFVNEQGLVSNVPVIG